MSNKRLREIEEAARAVDRRIREGEKMVDSPNGDGVVIYVRVLADEADCLRTALEADE